MLYFHPCVGVRSGFLTPGYANKTQNACYMPHPSHSSLVVHPVTVHLASGQLHSVRQYAEYSIFILTHPCSTQTGCLPQYPVLRHPQPMFVSHRDTTTVTPTDSNSHNCESACWKFYVLKDDDSLDTTSCTESNKTIS